VRPRRPGDRGFVTVWTVALATVCWSLVGLVYDGGRALRHRSDAYGAAAAAARAGVQQLDEDAAVEGIVEIDQVRARSAAMGYLTRRGYSGSVSFEGTDVVVEVTGDTQLQVLPGTMHFVVSASARPYRGEDPA
jgi:Flp pilus assembly protein TadG